MLIGSFPAFWYKDQVRPGSYTQLTNMDENRSFQSSTVKQDDNEKIKGERKKRKEEGDIKKSKDEVEDHLALLILIHMFCFISLWPYSRNPN